jgi:hypothetical protein
MCIPESVLESGKKAGYITYRQLNECLSDDEVDGDRIMELLVFLEGHGVDLIDESKVENREEEKREVESSQRSLLRFVHSVNNKLALIRKCKSIPATERLSRTLDLRWQCGYVYLMEKMVLTGERPNRKYQRVPNPVHKIGKTDRKWKTRSNELWNQYRLIHCDKYPTVVAFALEQALHRHYDDFRVRRQGERQKGQRKNMEGERFRLPPNEVANFCQTAALVESWVLIAEEATLELALLQAKFTAEKLCVKPEVLLP